ncbi:MAG TPA: hypothetical protein VGZ00_01005 [Candidatus Baltobacteraceae bacterium]|jgi:hypothetical protein|nr:hypothetical protein [Candidatus Baltobacteraceae bacterium]
MRSQAREIEIFPPEPKLAVDFWYGEVDDYARETLHKAHIEEERISGNLSGQVWDPAEFFSDRSAAIGAFRKSPIGSPDEENKRSGLKTGTDTPGRSAKGDA